MPQFLLEHRHEPHECAAAYAAWKGFQSPLRRHSTISSCVAGGHGIWWKVEAEGPEQALALLPPWVAVRTEPTEVRDVAIP